MVVATISMIAMVAVPRITTAAQNSQQTVLIATTDVLQRSIDLYTAEHCDQSPAIASSGAIDASGVRFVARLLNMTDESGGNSAGAIFGPYLRSMARNVLNGLATVRVDGVAAGANTHGWRFDTPSGRVVPDDPVGAKLVTDRFKGKVGGVVGGGKVGGEIIAEGGGAVEAVTPAVGLGE